MYPLRVICIDGSRRPSDFPGTRLPKEGESYTALDELPGIPFNDQNKRHPCYVIYELLDVVSLPNGSTGVMVYEKDRFIPASDEDEVFHLEEVTNDIFEQQN